MTDNISKLTYPYFTDNETRLEANTLNPIIQKINDIIDKVNGTSPSPTPTPTTVEVPTISLNTSTKKAALSASEGLTIKYSTDGSTPTTTYSSPITMSGNKKVCAITTNGTDSSSVPSLMVLYNDTTGKMEFVTNISNNDDYRVRFTTNGETPTTSSTIYRELITPSAGTTYKAAVFSTDAMISDIITVVVDS